MKRHLGSMLVVLAALAAVVLLKTAGQPAAARGQFKDDPPPTAAYERACTADPGSAACALLHGAMRSRALEALAVAAAARDQRSVASVVGYLDLADEPELHEAAGRVLAQHPKHPGAATRARKLLFSDHPVSQRAAAGVLAQSADPTDRHLAAQWRSNHKHLPHDFLAYQRQAPQPDPARVQLQRYPGAERFAPADGPALIGLATADPIDRVVAFYARATGATAIGAEAWQARLMAQLQVQGKAVQAEMPDLSQDPDIAEVGRIAKEYQRTRNPALLKKMAAVSKRLDEKGRQARQRMEAAQARTGAGLLESYTIPGDHGESPWRTARFLVAEQRGGRVARVVVVYREEALGKTVVQLAWDPAAFPGVPPL